VLGYERAAASPGRACVHGVTASPAWVLQRLLYAHARHLAQAGERAVQIGLRAAARLCGKNQSTIHCALKTGRLSYTLGEGGERRIDVAE
jgi:hypothetical protein